MPDFEHDQAVLSQLASMLLNQYVVMIEKGDILKLRGEHDSEHSSQWCRRTEYWCAVYTDVKDALAETSVSFDEILKDIRDEHSDEPDFDWEDNEWDS